MSGNFVLCSTNSPLTPLARYLLVTTVVCAVGSLLLVIVTGVDLPLFGAGLLLQDVYFVLVTSVFWGLPGSLSKRLALIALITLVTGVVGGYLGSLVYPKLEFPAAVLQTLFFQVVAVPILLTLAWAIEKVLPRRSLVSGH